MLKVKLKLKLNIEDDNVKKLAGSVKLCIHIYVGIYLPIHICIFTCVCVYRLRRYLLNLDRVAPPTLRLIKNVQQQQERQQQLQLLWGKKGKSGVAFLRRVVPADTFSCRAISPDEGACPSRDRQLL